MYEAIIAGGGMGGLVTGALLAKRGFKVLLLEKAPFLGGRARATIKDGYTLDYGIHLIRFGEYGLLPRVFDMLGLRLDMAHLGKSVLISGEEYALPVNVEGVMQTEFLNQGEKNIALQLLMEILSVEEEKALDNSVQEYISSKGAPDKVIRLMSIISGLLLVTPHLSLASLGELAGLIRNTVEFGVGAGYPIGGWNGIIKGLSESILNSGGEIRLHSRVKSIEISDSMVKGVAIGDRLITADKVVVSTDKDEAARILSNSAIGKIVDRHSVVTPTTGVGLDIAIDDDIGYDGLIVWEEPFIMGLFPSELDPELSPEGKHYATFLMPIPHDEYPDKKEEYMKLLLKSVGDWLDQKNTNYRILRKLYFPIVDGAAPYITQHWRKRIEVISPIRGLFLVGDWVGSRGAGSDIAVGAALKVYEHLISE